MSGGMGESERRQPGVGEAERRQPCVGEAYERNGDIDKVIDRQDVSPKTPARSPRDSQIKITPAPRRVGVYGGTYAPPHNGHIAAARAFVEQMKLDELLIIPASIPPHKSIDSSDLPEHRLAMCRLAFGNIERVAVSDMEIRRGGRSFTVDTLRELSEPGRKLFLLTGTDMMLTFEGWREFREIFRLACPVYIRRENDRALDAEIIARNEHYYREYGVAFRKIVAEPVVMSSSEIRNLIARGGDISEYVPSDVEKYIREKRLYGS